MFTVTTFDYLSGDTTAQTIDTFATEAEAREVAALHMEDAASYAEETHVRNALQVAAKDLGARFGAFARQVDGFAVTITPDRAIAVYQLHDGDWFSSLTVNGVAYNAPSDTPARAVLQSWTSYASHRSTLAYLVANLDSLLDS
jgi:hypothetical protein